MTRKHALVTRKRIQYGEMLLT